jgi:hypothetical protein
MLICAFLPIQSKLNCKILHSHAREVVSNVHAFMKREASQGIQIPVKDFGKRAADATGVPLRTVRHVVNERKYLESEEGPSTSTSTPGENKSKPSQKSTVDKFDEEVIRTSIHNFAINEGERPTVKNLHSKLVEHIAFSGSKSRLRRVLKKFGFKRKRTQNNRTVLTERRRHSIAEDDFH